MGIQNQTTSATTQASLIRCSNRLPFNEGNSIPVIDAHTWLPTRLFPDFDPNAVENGSFFEYIKNTYCCTIAESSRSTISVTAASPDMAKTLRLSSGDPVLILDSYMEAPDGSPLYISREYIAGSRYTISF